VLAYAVRRLATAVPVLVLVSLIAFVIVRLLPGDPAVLMLGPGATQQQIDALRRQLGLGLPWPVQYAQYVIGLARGDLGTSLQTGRPVGDELAQRLPATIELSLAAILLAVPLGLASGALSAVRRNTGWDHVGRLTALLGVSVPVFWLALVAQLVFGLWLDVLPVSGRTDAVAHSGAQGFVVLGAFGHGDLGLVADALRHVLLPALVLGAFFAATLSRMTRASMLEVLGDDYVRTARAKGLPGRAVVVRHALRNALLPVVTLGGLQVAELLGGAVLTETIFAWPGVGRYMFEAVSGRDYPVVQSTLLLFAVMYVVVLLVVDLAYSILDPRLRTTLAAA
jgi:ABC-type dipeptide/oligopeptide/nickel transport system permease component